MMARSTACKLGGDCNCCVIPSVARDLGFWILDFGFQRTPIENPKSKIQNPKSTAPQVPRYVRDDRVEIPPAYDSAMIIWIHGFPLSSRVFEKQRSFPGFAPDLPGFGSAAPPSPDM